MTEGDCIFCKIVEGALPAKVHYDDEQVLAFADIDPKAPVHLLVIPKRHIPSMLALEETDREVLFAMIQVGQRLAKEQGIAESGFRFVTNCGREGGQAVSHLHFHLLGGRPMTWPPG